MNKYSLDRHNANSYTRWTLSIAIAPGGPERPILAKLVTTTRVVSSIFAGYLDEYAPCRFGEAKEAGATDAQPRPFEEVKIKARDCRLPRLSLPLRRPWQARGARARCRCGTIAWWFPSSPPRPMPSIAPTAAPLARTTTAPVSMQCHSLRSGVPWLLSTGALPTLWGRHVVASTSRAERAVPIVPRSRRAARGSPAWRNVSRRVPRMRRWARRARIRTDEIKSRDQRARSSRQPWLRE